MANTQRIILCLIFLLFHTSLRAEEKFSRYQVIDQQMDCVGGYLTQGGDVRADNCENDMVPSTENFQRQTRQEHVPVETIPEPSERTETTVVVKEDIPEPAVVETRLDTSAVKESTTEQQTLITRRHTFDIAGEVYYNKYAEKEIGVSNVGAMNGFSGHYTYRPPAGNFLNNNVVNVYRFEGRYSQGKLDYKGSGKDKGILNKTYELRAWAGKDYVFADNSRATPYLGLAYRYLADLGGGRLTDQGYWGYDRKSHYYYLPIGVIVDIPTRDNTELSFNLEYDIFLQGTQKSYLSDGNQFTTAPSFDISNHQDKGFGIRSSIRYLKHLQPLDIYVEPFIRFWNIEDSKVMDTVVQGQFFQGLEPHNTTLEIGSKAGIQF